MMTKEEFYQNCKFYNHRGNNCNAKAWPYNSYSKKAYFLKKNLWQEFSVELPIIMWLLGSLGLLFNVEEFNYYEVLKT